VGDRRIHGGDTLGRMVRSECAVGIVSHLDGRRALWLSERESIDICGTRLAAMRSRRAIGDAPSSPLCSLPLCLDSFAGGPVFCPASGIVRLDAAATLLSL